MSSIDKRRILDKDGLGRLDNLDHEIAGQVTTSTVDVYDTNDKDTTIVTKKTIDRVSNISGSRS